MMCGILMMTLDLEHHPENAAEYAVNILAQTIPTDSLIGSPLPSGMENRLLQLVKAERLPNALVPKYLNGMAAQMTREMIRKHGGIRPDS